jgi:hypothetical protein
MSAFGVKSRRYHEDNPDLLSPNENSGDSDLAEYLAACKANDTVDNPFITRWDREREAAGGLSAQQLSAQDNDQQRTWTDQSPNWSAWKARTLSFGAEAHL